MQLSSNDRPIRRILAETFFVVPRYQRPYSWNRDNIDELLQDAIEQGPSDYFIGSIVVHPTTGDTVAVVDGQQRLTTLVMMLCAVRDVADDLGLAQIGNGTHNLVERRDEEDQVRPVIDSETARPFLEDFVISRGPAQLGGPKGEEQKAIQEAYQQVQAFVEARIDSVRKDANVPEAKKAAAYETELRGIREKVLSLQVVFSEAETQDDATTVFVTLNSRGKDLEPSDLVKAHLLTQMPKKGALDRPLKRWQSIIELFDASEARPDMTEFLLAVWRSRYGASTKKSLDKHVRKNIKGEEADRFLKELNEDASLFRTLVEPTSRRWRQSSDLAESLQFLLDFGISQPRPLLLSLLRAYDTGKIKVTQFRRALRAIENYHFTFNILAGRSSSGGMSAFYSSRALKLNGASGKQKRAEIIDALIAELKAKRPTDEEFDAAFLALEVTDKVTADRKKVRYILRRFHERHANRSAIDYAKMTIEHLAPQSGGSSWVGKVGNLIFVSETLNKKLDSKSPSAKKKILSAITDEWIPSDILKGRSWGEKEVLARTEQMAVEARREVWR